MRKVLIADCNPMLRDYLKEKLSEDQIDVILAQEGNLDLQAKLISNLPNLVILDMEDDDSVEMEFLEMKFKDTNAVNIPVIIMGPAKSRANIAALAKYGVIKYFEKPIQFDMFFSAIGSVVHVPLSMDTTPCVLDIHRNNDIIFVELALGLNREKLVLLKFKLAELIEREQIDNPKVIIMLTSLELSFIDGYNLEYLIDNVLACPKVHNKNVKVLSLSPFVKELINGHENYAGIDCSNSLPQIMKEIVQIPSSQSISELITNQVLVSSGPASQNVETLDTRFSSDSLDFGNSKKTGTVLTLAIIDSDEISTEIIKASFESAGAVCECYTQGQKFSDSYEDGKYDLIILDVLIQDKTGLSLLKYLQSRPMCPPIIVYSATTQKDIIVTVLSAGAKGYIVKPQKPNVLVQKALAILKEQE